MILNEGTAPSTKIKKNCKRNILNDGDFNTFLLCMNILVGAIKGISGKKNS